MCHHVQCSSCHTVVLVELAGQETCCLSCSFTWKCSCFPLWSTHGPPHNSVIEHICGSLGPPPPTLKFCKSTLWSHFCPTLCEALPIVWSLYITFITLLTVAGLPDVVSNCSDEGKDEIWLHSSGFYSDHSLVQMHTCRNEVALKASDAIPYNCHYR